MAGSRFHITISWIQYQIVRIAIITVLSRRFFKVIRVSDGVNYQFRFFARGSVIIQENYRCAGFGIRVEFFRTQVIGQIDENGVGSQSAFDFHHHRRRGHFVGFRCQGHRCSLLRGQQTAQLRLFPHEEDGSYPMSIKFSAK